MQNHTLTSFDTELNELKQLIQSMLKISQKNIKHSLKALKKGDAKLANKVIYNDEAVDALEVQADAIARDIIVRHQPAASDLRFVFAAIKIVSDLERLGDMAVSIAYNVLELNGDIPKNIATIPMMQEMVMDQLKKVFNAYQESNALHAQQIIEHNSLINQEFINAQRVILTYMEESPDMLSQYMALSNIAKLLERIGDHITNIAEMVIYSTKGFDVRHISAEEIKKLLSEEEDNE